jgi:hypothetical protein
MGWTSLRRADKGMGGRSGDGDEITEEEQP